MMAYIIPPVIFISIIGGLGLLLVWVIDRSTDRAEAKAKLERERLVYKDVGQMAGTWVIDGVRRPVAFRGTYRLCTGRHCGDFEIVSEGVDRFDALLKLAKKTGFIYERNYEGYVHEEDPVLIALSRISEISVKEESLIVAREVDDD